MTLTDIKFGNEIFLQGSYLTLGINGSGSLGTKKIAPDGIFTDIANGFNRVGMYADFDGFGVGKSSTVTEAMLDGTPTEGFTIGYKIGGSTFIAANQERTSRINIAGISSDRSTANVAKAGWVGATTEKLAVDQTISLTDDGKFVRVDVVLTNKSSSAMDDLRYMRSIDPDQGSSFSTENKIVSQSGSAGALVAAYANGATPVFYYAEDARAVVSTTAGYRSVDPYTAAVSTAPQATGYTLKGDNVINIAFNVGSLDAGDKTTLTYYMGVTDNLDTTIAAIKGEPAKPINAPPVAANDGFALIAGAAISGNVLLNDHDANGDRLSATLLSGPKNGTVFLNKDGTFTYEAESGFIGTDTFTYAASDGKASDVATVTMKVSAPAPTNIAPTAVDDAYNLVAGGSVKGFVLANDRDANGDALVAALKSGPANGSVSIANDGSFVYTAKAGFSGTDSFVYTASDGKLASAATVTLTVTAPETTPPVTPPPVTPSIDPLLTRAGTVDVSATDDQTVAGAAYHNSFFVNTKSVSGSDRITNFAHNDVLVTDEALFDGNGDGVIGLTGGTAKLDPLGSDTLQFDGLTGLRSMGASASGLHVYADASVRPADAIESILGNEVLRGDAGDARAQTFFFDTALDLDLGSDQLINFGSKDILVTTSSLLDGNRDTIIAFGSGGRIKLLGDSGAPGDKANLGEAGSIAISDVNDGAVNKIEFDGAVLHDGTTYYVYSLIGSAGGVDTLHF
jgi:VCBS repeat-containing protein